MTIYVIRKGNFKLHSRGLMGLNFEWNSYVTHVKFKPGTVEEKFINYRSSGK
jgi:hypothetical protein